MYFYFQVSQSELKTNYSKKQGGSALTLEQKESQETNQKSFVSKKKSFLRLGEVFLDKEKKIEVKISKFDPSFDFYDLARPKLIDFRKITKKYQAKNIFDIL